MPDTSALDTYRLPCQFPSFAVPISILYSCLVETPHYSAVYQDGWFTSLLDRIYFGSLVKSTRMVKSTSYRLSFYLLLDNWKSDNSYMFFKKAVFFMEFFIKSHFISITVCLGVTELRYLRCMRHVTEIWSYSSPFSSERRT